MRQEIQNWRKSRILPETYCDFLLTLYGLEADNPAQAQSSHSQQHWTDKVLSLTMRQSLTVFISIAFICIVGIYFTVFPLPLQILTVGSLFFLLGIRAVKVKEGHAAERSFLMGAGLTVLSIGGYWILTQLEGITAEEWHYYRIGFLLLAAALWCLCGNMIRSAWIQWIGVMHGAVVYALMIMKTLPEMNSLLLQWLWIPESFLLVWLAWMVHKQKRGLSGALLLSALSCIIAPELMQFFRSDIDSSWLVQVESILLAKLLTLFLIAFYFRKQWVKWIRDNETV